MSCEDIPSLLDLQNAKKNIDDLGRLMGEGEGDSTNEVTGQVRPTYNKVMKSVGFKPGSGDFTTGFTVMPGQRDHGWYDPISKNWYSYLGIIQAGGHVVAPGTNPVGNADWKAITDFVLRYELSQPDGSSKVGFTQADSGAVPRTSQDKMGDIISIIDFGAIGDGNPHPLSEKYFTLADAKAKYPFVTSLAQTQDYAAIQAALNFAHANGSGGVVYIPSVSIGTGRYITKDPIIIPTYVSVYGDGIGSVIKADASLVGDVLKIDTGPSVGPMFLRDFGVIGNGTCNGIGTTITDDITGYKFIYGYTLFGLHVTNCEIGYLFQGLWHSTFANCISSACRIGVQFRGQNVSVLTSGCHFRRDGRAVANTAGIHIQTYHYNFLPAGDKALSEALIIDGETMCIGQETGIWIDGGLDFHFSNLDLDFIWNTGIRVTDINSVFTISDSWIAADSMGTGQFIGIHFVGQTVGQPKILRGVNITSRNSATELNLGIQAISGGLLNVYDCSFLDGSYSLYLKNYDTGVISGNSFGPVWFENNQNITFENNRVIGGITYNNPSGYLTNRWGSNSNIGTSDALIVPMPPSATSGTASIPLPVPGAKYSVVQEHIDPLDKADTVEISGTTVTVRRSAPSPTIQIDAVVRYKIFK